MSLHNLATVFGPTLLRPSEKDSKISNSSQPISMNDSWSLEVMAQVKTHLSDNWHFALEARVWSPARVLLCRCKSSSTSSSWRAFQHLTANVKAFSSLQKYNSKSLHLNLWIFHVEGRMLAAADWLFYSKDTKISHQVEPQTQCKLENSHYEPRASLFKVWAACVFTYKHTHFVRNRQPCVLMIKYSIPLFNLI